MRFRFRAVPRAFKFPETERSGVVARGWGDRLGSECLWEGERVLEAVVVTGT